MKRGKGRAPKHAAPLVGMKKERSLPKSTKYEEDEGESWVDGEKSEKKEEKDASLFYCNK